MAQARASARFSTYSGAPSLQPSLAPTLESTTTSQPSARNSQATATYLTPNTYEKAPYNAKEGGAATSTSTLNSSDPKSADIKSWSGALERMQDERLDKQRFTMSANKSDEVKALALGAKLERALGRRMVGQDATFSRKPSSRKPVLDAEKRKREVEAR